MTEIAIRDEPHYLATIAEVRVLVERIESIGDAKALADKARTLQVWAERAKLGQENVDLAIAARLWAERRAGELLGDDPKVRRGGSKGRPSRLKELGVGPDQSKRWQRLATIPATEFEEITECGVEHGKLATALKGAGRSKRDAAKKAQREQAEAQARTQIEELGERAATIERRDIATWRPAGVSCIVTDPPYITDNAVELHSLLADFAVDVLPAHGALAVMTWQPLLPAVLEAMRRPTLVYRWTAAWVFETSARTPERKPRVFDGWKPILVFHKDGWTNETTYLYDVVKSPDADKGSHAWGQNIDGFRQLVRAFSQPGETVCDPFVGGGTTAVAALAEQRLFVGCDIDESAIATAQERIAA